MEDYTTAPGPGERAVKRMMGKMRQSGIWLEVLQINPDFSNSEKILSAKVLQGDSPLGKH